MFTAALLLGNYSMHEAILTLNTKHWTTEMYSFEIETNKKFYYFNIVYFKVKNVVFMMNL